MVNPIKFKLRTKKIGILLKDARIAAGKNRKDCATATGISNSRLGAFESGQKTPSLTELEILAFYLKVPLEHFWSQESLSVNIEKRIESSNLIQLISLRTRIISVLLRQARIEAEMSLKDLAGSVGITPGQLKSYENAKNPIPVHELEGMANHLNLQLDYFRDKDGVVGKWTKQQKNIQQFLNLPMEVQDFVVKPVNLPYLEIAQRLSDLSVEKLRALAEDLLDITL